MKKICFITTISSTLESFVLNTAKYLHENTDWNISFICDENEEFKNNLPDYIHYYPIPMKRGISLTGIKSMNQMRKIFKEQKFDLIQYSTPNASLYASLAGFLTRTPIRLYCQWGMVYVGFSGIKRKIFKLIEKLICGLSTWIEPDSYSNLEFAHKEKLYNKNKGSVVWNGSACGIDINKFDYANNKLYRKEIRNKLNIEDNKFIFGFVGRITRDKGINELFEASKRIMEKNKDIMLMLVGSEETDGTINKELYKWSKENKQVIYCGYTKEVEKYLCAIDCYILPSYREGFGMGTIEAEAMGVPVIVTDIPGPIDAMKKDVTGLIVKKADVRSLKKAMIKLLENRDLCIEYGKNGVEFVTNNFEQQTFFNYIKMDREDLFNKYLNESRRKK